MDHPDDLSRMVGPKAAKKISAEAGTSSEKLFQVTATSLKIKSTDENGDPIIAKFKYYHLMNGNGYVAVCAVRDVGIFFRYHSKLPNGKKVEKD